MPEFSTVLAFDYGVRKLGVALGNTLLRQAQPLEIIDIENKVRRFERIGSLVSSWQPQRLVVGLPLTQAGAEQLATRQARRFANQLRDRYGLDVMLVDERGSSLEAQQVTRHSPDDAVAAAIILQRYFDSLQN
ncbi:Holliday junction resolvase RuvX [Orrella marina]|uniref:Putative pre-16S rRNA nuclease n=1 Tax=Orrella marina TaxID=2163011 RepID=A0A2R4XMZ3_9BURK|nr:Holliday junction resolvase RuvX [Orrella marina]AWB35148.1 Holliday junction resolvase RuvX [Orrella marina]